MRKTYHIHWTHVHTHRQSPLVSCRASQPSSSSTLLPKFVKPTWMSCSSTLERHRWSPRSTTQVKWNLHQTKLPWLGRGLKIGFRITKCLETAVILADQFVLIIRGPTGLRAFWKQSKVSSITSVTVYAKKDFQLDMRIHTHRVP